MPYQAVQSTTRVFLCVACLLAWQAPALGEVYITYDVIVMDATMQPYPGWNQGKLWSQKSGVTTDVRVMDSDSNVTILSPHRFELYQPAPSDPLPWTYYSENVLIGKKINVDISGAIMAIEQLTGKQFMHLEDLPADKILDLQVWKTSATLRMIEEAKQAAVKADPWIEIPFSEASEEVDETVVQQSVQTVTKFRINWETQAVEPYQVEETTEVAIPTGAKVRQLRPDVRFDEETGKCFRPRTLDDVAIDAQNLPEPEPPQYVLDRLPLVP